MTYLFIETIHYIFPIKELVVEELRDPRRVIGMFILITGLPLILVATPVALPTAIIYTSGGIALIKQF
jgi:hypothetical protein